MPTAEHPKHHTSQNPAQNEIVEQAKRLLMEQCGMSEPEAHRYLQQSAMDRRIPKPAAAMCVLHKLGKL